eukprot:5151222-Pleurochrysis_carterae.AAC.1
MHAALLPLELAIGAPLRLPNGVVARVGKHVSARQKRGKGPHSAPGVVMVLRDEQTDVLSASRFEPPGYRSPSVLELQLPEERVAAASIEFAEAP